MKSGRTRSRDCPFHGSTPMPGPCQRCGRQSVLYNVNKLSNNRLHQGSHTTYKTVRYANIRYVYVGNLSGSYHRYIVIVSVLRGTYRTIRLSLRSEATQFRWFSRAKRTVAPRLAPCNDRLPYVCNWVTWSSNPLLDTLGAFLLA